jgi:N-acetylglucosamine transport system substrate-binding protein
MKLKKMISLSLALALTGSVLSGCAMGGDSSGGSSDESGTKTLKVAALESAYGSEMWQEVIKAFESQVEGVKVELTIDKNLEDVISPKMKSGDYPDVVHLATGREDALTETMIKEDALLCLEDVLTMKVPGEEKTVKEKLVPGFTDTLVTNPYEDGKTYLAPMFYGPCGLFYNAGLLEEKGWEVPKTWDEMWALGDKAKAEGISLFTYPTTGYFDAFSYALFNNIGGPDFFNKAMTYSEGVWNSPEADQYFKLVKKLSSYTEPTTVANANKDNFKKNQQLVLDNKALFMPNGTWVIEEMKDAPRAENFKWGFTAIPAVKEGGDSYSFTFFEQAWIPKKSENQELAKQFVAFLYSDKAAEIFAKKGAVQPIEGVSSYFEEGSDNKLFYSIYDNGAKAAMGGFAATAPVEGVSMFDSLFGTVDSVISGDKTVEQWKQAVTEASDKLRAAMK